MASRFRIIRCFFPTTQSARIVGFAVAAILAGSVAAHAQVAPASSDSPSTPAAAQPAQTVPPVTLSNVPAAKTRKQDKVIESKDTKKENKKVSKDNPLQGVDASLPDKVLYDKALDAVKHGRYDVARLDLQTLLNTYSESQYQMRAKLAIADSWFKEGGTAALTQAEQEYKDFITFFPNAPEAAEAQMRVGDIYFKQMDKPDRDYAKAVSAEHEYRLFLQQFPESVLVPQVTQRLRDVQEVMATREASVGDFYASHQNFAATIGRYQTVVDTYPLYSHLDQVLIGLGDAYEAQAHFVRGLNLPEGGKARLEKVFDDQAAAAYRKVVLEHSAAPHAEDAKDRLAAMCQSVPTPTAEQLAASAALEASRSQYHLTDVVRLLFLHEPDTVLAATISAPTLEDPAPTLAPSVIHKNERDFATALNPVPLSSGPATAAVKSPTTEVAPTPAPAPAPAAKLAFEDVPTAETGGGAAINTSVSVGPATHSSSSSGMSAEIVNSGSSPAAAPADASGGLALPADKSKEPLPAVEKPAVAPDVLNDVPATGQPGAAAATNGKKPACDKSDESCSSKKKKKGLAKLNPF